MFVRIASDDRMRTGDQSSIFIVVRFLLLLFSSTFDFLILSQLVCVVLFLLKTLFFITLQFFTVFSFFTVLITGDTKQFYSTSCIFSKYPDLISLFFSNITI